MKKNFVFFDFDGVIADSFKPAFEIGKLISPKLTEERFRRGFEGNINDWDWEELEGSEIDFITEYTPRLKKEVRTFPGTKEAIAELAKLHELIIISSTDTRPIMEFLKDHNLSEHFTEVMGNDVHTKKSEKIRMVFDKYGIGPKNSVFVTDTLGDIMEADSVGVRSIAVNWGFHPSETLLRGKPFRLVEKPADLPTVVRDYFNSKILTKTQKMP